VYAPSQNASAIVKLTDIPVSYYTGSPQVNFPLFNIRSGELQHNISLGYTSGGISVQMQDNSLVG
jgi:hypothetical protein